MATAKKAMTTAEALARYDGIVTDLRAISVDEMLARFAALKDCPRGVLAAVLKAAGYSDRGTKKATLGALLGNLTSLKISFDQCRMI